MLRFIFAIAALVVMARLALVDDGGSQLPVGELIVAVDLPAIEAIAPNAGLDQPSVVAIAPGEAVPGDVLGPPLSLRGPWRASERLAPGDRMIDALIRGGASQNDAYRAVEALRDFVDPRRLQVGQEFDLQFRADDGLEANRYLTRVELRTGFDEKVAASLGGDGKFTTEKSNIPTEKVLMYGAGEIDDSLFLAAEAEAIPPMIIVELIRIFSFEVDFQREIWPGDSFRVLFERSMISATGEVDNGTILYAELVLRGETKGYYRFQPEGRNFADYYDGSGRSARRALMKTPIDGARLSSRFGMRRHPILGYNLAHTGVDFGAPTGTPIFAAGDGMIEHAARDSVNGNLVRIRHNGTYGTAYAHMSRYGRGIRKGVRVRQGQIIGYVGATGRAQGSHLHYVVYRDGVKINPLTLKLPTGETLKDATLEAFNAGKAGHDELLGTFEAYFARLDALVTEAAAASSPPGRFAGDNE